MSYSAFAASHGECSFERRKDWKTDVITYVIIATDRSIAIPTAELNESIIKSEEQANNPKMDLNKIKVREYHVGYQNTNIFVAYTN